MLPDAPQERRRSMDTKPPCVLLLLGLVQNMGRSAEAFTAYDCSTKSNTLESYSLLEPDACAASDGNGEMESVVYRKYSANETG